MFLKLIFGIVLVGNLVEGVPFPLRPSQLTKNQVNPGRKGQYPYRFAGSSRKFDDGGNVKLTNEYEIMEAELQKHRNEAAGGFPGANNDARARNGPPRTPYIDQYQPQNDDQQKQQQQQQQRYSQYAPSEDNTVKYENAPRYYGSGFGNGNVNGNGGRRAPSARSQSQLPSSYSANPRRQLYTPYQSNNKLRYSGASASPQFRGGYNNVNNRRNYRNL